MYKNYVYYLTTFISLVLIIYFTSKSPSNLLISIGITALLFFFFNLIVSSVYFLKKETKKALQNLLIAISLGVLMLKINYEFYNLIFPIIVILISIYFYNKSKHITLTVLLFNLIILFTPDNFLFKYQNSNMTTWGPEISWENFKGNPKKNSTFSASIYSEFRGKINKMSNYPPALLYATIDEQKSWKKHLKNSDALLAHEQIHFDITELFKRKALDSVNKSWGKSPKEIEAIIVYYAGLEDNYQSQYDSITQHGINKENQKIWSKKISKELISLN